MIQSSAFIKYKPVPTATQEFYLGLDCGQAQDYSAISILQKQANRYDVVYLERLPLDMPYPAQIEHIFQICNKKPISTANKVLAIDYTGVGRPIVDLAQDRGLHPIGVAITGGNSVSWNEDKTRASVPKRDLIAGLQISAQNDRLKVASGLQYGPVLAEELQSFKVKIDPRTAHDSYGSWREGEHDDLILSLAIALWIAENRDAPTHAILRYISRIGR
jgi:hypothetical protein